MLYTKSIISVLILFYKSSIPSSVESVECSHSFFIVFRVISSDSKQQIVIPIIL